jgi:hypothetical protein
MRCVYDGFATSQAPIFILQVLAHHAFLSPLRRHPLQTVTDAVEWRPD